MNISVNYSHLNPLHHHEPVSFTLSRFLRKQGIRLNNDTLRQELARHPHYPSLLSISDVLNSMGISHQAYQTDIDALAGNFHQPLFTHLNLQGSEVFALIERFENTKFMIVTEKAETYWYTKEELKKTWNGILLELENGEEPVRLTENKQSQTYPPLLKYGSFAFILFASGYFIYMKTAVFSLQQVLLLALNCAAIALSWILVLQRLNKNNALVKQLCQSKTREGCGSVLSSKASQITPWLSMAEAGLIYFTAAALSVFLFKIPVLALYLALLAPLYSLYAIYIQAFVLKEWCRLCMGIHVIVLAGFSSALIFYPSLLSSLQWPAFIEFAVFLIPAVIWLTIYPLIKKLKDARHYRQEYTRLKADPELFKTLTDKHPKIHIPGELKVFQFGNPEAVHELTFISNPFCGPCAKAHQVIDEWLQNNGLDFKITIIFIHHAEAGDRNRQFVEYISGITDKGKLKAALHNWFNTDKKDLSSWAEKMQLDKTALKYDAEHLQQWMNTAGVNATPSFFINSRKLPEKYRIEDIKYLITEAD